MAFIFADSFETITTAVGDLELRGWELFLAPLIETSVFKDGTQCIKLDANEQARWFLPTGTGFLGKGFLSFWFRINYTPGSVRTLIDFKAGGSYILRIKLNTDKTFFWEDAVGARIGSDSAFGITENQWHHIEIKWEFLDSTAADSCVCRLDGVDFCNVDAGEDTLFTASHDDIDGFRFLTSGTISDWNYFDSVIFWDSDSGDDWNDFRGQLRIETLTPNADGDDSDLLGSDGNQISNFQQVDEVNDFHDADSTYNESGGIGDKDSYNFPNMTASDVGGILGVQVAMVSKKTTSGGPDFTPFYVDGGIDRDGAEHVLTNGVYSYGSHLFDENPEDAAPWTAAKISSGHFGLRVS